MQEHKSPKAGNDRGSSTKQPFSPGSARTKSNAIEVPSISLPKGGGAIKGIDEKFSVNAVNGTAGFSIPLSVSEARGFSPALGLSYSSGAGNGLFGMGWSLGIPSISRKTDKKLPEYRDSVSVSAREEEVEDTFLLAGAEDLVPAFQKDGSGGFVLAAGEYVVDEFDRNFHGTDYSIRRYLPRIEGLFSRIERWTVKSTGIMHWRTISKENVTALYGKTALARVAAPKDATRVFEWLLEFTYDDKGNCTYYEYKPEDGVGMPNFHHNRNRLAGTYTNVYLKRVLYGVRLPYNGNGNTFPTAVTDYFFENMLDYGEHDALNAPFPVVQDWDFREDAFSDYRAGFEVRTARLVKRVLLYHHFAELPNGVSLVKSVDFNYGTNGLDGFTFLQSVITKGYIQQPNGTYTMKEMPPFSFSYQTHAWDTTVQSLTTENLVHAPIGNNNGDYHFVDLYSEGLSGILTEQGGGWHYKSNLGKGNFTHAKLVSPKPSFQGLNQAVQIMDLEGNGIKQLVQTQGEPKGYFELSPDEDPIAIGWQRFQTFEAMPTLQQDSFTRMLDLNGDGLADILMAEPNGFTWYPSKGKKGYDRSRKVAHSFDEELAPAIVFADSTQSIFLSDMGGDGLTDIVRIRNGEVCYWPNLGYGRFGAKVSLDNAPLFDHVDRFNPAFIQLADIDGSGASDIIYLGQNKFSIYLNRQGNRLADPVEINPFPEINNAINIEMADLLGTGLSCIVWNSKLSKHAQQPTRYIDLMSSKKPHVMIGYQNNLGKEVTMEYKPSTAYYIADKLAGNPWVTKLHFPVHCVARTETRDRITRTLLVSEYAYHHGYYDHFEKEFRGFGMVEQTDAEDFEHWAASGGTNIVDATLHEPPVKTKSWFHTGAFFDKEKILTQFAHEYWHEEMARAGFVVPSTEMPLPDARLISAPGIAQSVIDGMGADEWREALRACKSMALRSEVFALDAGAVVLQKSLTPYTVGTHNCMMELLQPRGKNRHAVWVVKESEAITYSYERDTTDPRVAHTLNIALDEYGNVLEQASVVYPRAVADPSLPAETQQAQAQTIIVYSQTDYTHDVVGADTNRLRLPSEVRTYALNESSIGLFTLAGLKIAFAAATQVPYEAVNALHEKRLIEHIRSIFLADDLVTPLPLGGLGLRGLPFENYQLAYTPSLLSDIFGSKISAPNLLMPEGRFTHSEGDANWWVRSGTTQFVGSTETVADANARFVLPISFTDPFGSVTKVTYYGTYFLFVESTEDALGNVSSVDLFNFRTLSPQRMKDINANLSEAISDELGMVKAMAVYGKGNEADDLVGLHEYRTAVDDASVAAFLAAGTTTDLRTYGNALLQHATMRLVYDQHRYVNSGGTELAVVASIVREEHFAKDPASPLQLSFEYSNGFGKVVMKKVQAEPGLAKQVVLGVGNSYSVSVVNTGSDLRWIGNGRTILNNKGNPVKQYEPYFSVTHHYEDQKELVESGVTPVIYYDAIGRAVRTELPDGTVTRVEFDSWKQLSFDQNDTVLEAGNRWYADRIGNGLGAAALDAAVKSAAHADTPAQQHLDVLGRPVLSVEDNGPSGKYNTRALLDIEGNVRSVTDAMGNVVMAYKYDMLGNLVFQDSMDAGKRWLLTNALAKPLRTWDERNHEFRYFYDALHRPLQSVVRDGDGPLPLDNVFDLVVYGESLGLPTAAAQALNILGQPVQHFDTGGLVDTPSYDFQGKPISNTRHLFSKYKEVANWVGPNLVNDLEAETFTFITETDALGRIYKQIAPDGSIIWPSYNEAGLLNAETVDHLIPLVSSTYLSNIDYNEKGQRSSIIYGNGVKTTYAYDPFTFRLARLVTRRISNVVLQDLHYTYDAVGNITRIWDDAIPDLFYSGQKVEPACTYTYDALYRLVEATGRENDQPLTHGSCDNWHDNAYKQAMQTNDPMMARRYTQRYQFDAVGNIRQMQHLTSGSNSWTRDYRYNNNDTDRNALVVPPSTPKNNRLLQTQVGADTFNYTHHAAHGFMAQVPHLTAIDWNFKEEVVTTIRQSCNGTVTPMTTYYQYDGQGQRIRKITENQALPGQQPTVKEQRIYIAGFEVYKQTSTGLVRNSLSLLEEGHRFVMVVTRNAVNDGTPAHLVRYQLHNHLGSSALELDDAGEVISYEEYHPFGTTAFQALSAVIAAAAKRYRYTGMERDEETGMSYHSARYYLPWLGRWLSGDPIGIGDGVNLYGYCGGRVLNYSDQKGTQSKSSKLSKEPAKTTRSTLQKHTVKKGESLVEIAKSHGISVEKLRKLNNLDPKNDRSLQIGRALLISTTSKESSKNHL